jgi:hypothetical protein
LKMRRNKKAREGKRDKDARAPLGRVPTEAGAMIHEILVFLDAHGFGSTCFSAVIEALRHEIMAVVARLGDIAPAGGEAGHGREEDEQKSVWNLAHETPLECSESGCVLRGRGRDPALFVADPSRNKSRPPERVKMRKRIHPYVFIERREGEKEVWKVFVDRQKRIDVAIAAFW